MVDLATFARLTWRDSLCVVTATRADGSVQASVVNAGVLTHPVTPDDVVAYVVRGDAVKLRLLRARPWASVTVRVGPEWATVEGPVELIGPDDPHEAVDPERLRLLLREVFVAAGGDHDDWDEYDRVMAAERRTVVIVRPAGVYGITR